MLPGPTARATAWPRAVTVPARPATAPCSSRLPSAAVRGPGGLGGSSAASAPARRHRIARAASCGCAIKPRRSDGCTLPGCPGAPSAVDNSPPAQPRRTPPTRTGRQHPLGEPGTAPPPRLLGIACLRIAGAGGSPSPKPHRPVAGGPLPSYALPGYWGPWTRTPPAARPQPIAPSGPCMPPAASVTRWECRCPGVRPLAQAPRQSARVQPPSRRAARRRRGPRGPKLGCPRCGPTQRPLVRAAAPADPAPVSGADGKPILSAKSWHKPPSYLKVGTHLANCLQTRRKIQQARFIREGRCSAHIGANVRTCPGESLQRAPLPKRSLNVGT